MTGADCTQIYNTTFWAKYNWTQYNYTEWAPCYTAAGSGFVDPTPYMNLIVGLGVGATVENLLILLVLCSNKRLMRSSSLLIGLTLSHVLNGAMFATTFWPRPYSFDTIAVTSCLAKVHPVVYVTVYQLTPLILILIGLERCVAVSAPLWYRVTCSHGRLWKATGLVYGFAVVLFLMNTSAAWFIVGAKTQVSSGCSAPELFTLKYLSFAIHLPAVMGGLTATLLTAYGMRVGYRHIRKLPKTSKAEIGRMNRQIRLTKCVLLVSLFDLICVVIPNFILLLYNEGWIKQFSTVLMMMPNILYILDSALNIVAFLLFNREFRIACIKLIKCKSTTSVEPVSFGQTLLVTAVRKSPERIVEDQF